MKKLFLIPFLILSLALPMQSHAVKINGQLEGAILEKLPAPPAIGTEGRIFYHTDNKKGYIHNGTDWTTLGSGGGINYVGEDDRDAESASFTWAAYANTTPSEIPEVTPGGTPTQVTITRTSSALLGTHSYLLTKYPGGSGLGEGVRVPLKPIDLAHRARMLTVSFEVQPGGGYVAEDAHVYIITPSGKQILIGKLDSTEGFPYPFVGYFQSEASGEDYELAIHCASSNTSGYTVKFDNISVGPQSKVFGSTTRSPQKAGFIQEYAGSVAPDGWMFTDGSELSQTEYADLFANIGTTFNTQINPTTGSAYSAPAAGKFRIPDLRGTFVRGVGTPNGQSAVTLGGYQTDRFQGHNHGFQNLKSSVGEGDVSNRVLGVSGGTTNTEFITGPQTYGSYGNVRIGTETRPRNLGLHYIIKLYNDVVVPFSSDVVWEDDIGHVAFFARTTDPAGYVSTENKTIGLTAADYSGERYRALYEYIWELPGVTTTSTNPLSISSAKGASASADWAAGKTIRLNFTANEVFLRSYGSTATLGGYQADATKKNGLALSDPGHTHGQDFRSDATGFGVQTPALSNLSGTVVTASVATKSASTGITLGNGDAETRPKSLALKAFVKYARTPAPVVAHQGVRFLRATTTNNNTTDSQTTVVNWSNVTKNTLGTYSNGVFTSLATDSLRVKARARFAAIGVNLNTSFYLIIRKNGDMVARHRVNTASGENEPTANVSDIVDVVAGDTIDIVAYQETGGTIPLSSIAADNIFTIEAIN